MHNDILLSKQIEELLRGGQAYSTYEQIVSEFPATSYNTLFPNGTYTPWHLLEHIRRTQNDILLFMTAKKYKALSWPKDYWPGKNEKADKNIWSETNRLYQKDLDFLLVLLTEKKNELLTEVPNGDGQTYLREFMLVSQHTSYHLGEFSIMRQVMDTWGKRHGG